MGGLASSRSGTMTVLTVATTDQFFTPQASEEPLRPATAEQSLSSESLPQGFSRSFSINERANDTAERGPATAHLEEFDPLGLMTFTSLPRFPGANPTVGMMPKPAPAGPSGCLLLDIDEGLAPSQPPRTPTSVAKFSEREVQQLKQQYEERLERQEGLLQLEVSSLQEKYTQALRAAEEMRLLLTEYERTMAGLLEIRRVHPERWEGMGAAEEERQRLIIEAQSLRIAFSNLRQNYEENKRALDALRSVPPGRTVLSLSPFDSDLNHLTHRVSKVSYRQ